MDIFKKYTDVLENSIGMDSIAGTYCGVLPPNVETTLTLNADGTYSLKKKYALPCVVLPAIRSRIILPFSIFVGAKIMIFK